MDLLINQDTGTGGTIRFPITAIKARLTILTDITITTTLVIAGIHTHIATIGILTIAITGGTDKFERKRRSDAMRSPQLFFQPNRQSYL